MTDGYALYRQQLRDDVAARADELTDVDREMLRYADELEGTEPGMWLGAGRIAHEMVRNSLRRRSNDPMDRAMQKEWDRLALKRERCVIFGECE